MTSPRPDLAARACWCGADALEAFSEFYRVCASCGTLVSQFNQGADVSRVTDDAADLYGKDYWFSHMEEDLGFVNIYERARRDLAERAPYWLRTLLRHRLPPGRVLELGSAHGGFVALLAQAGFQATGLELSPGIVEIARELFGVPMLTGPIEDQALAPGSLDVIALMDVLEHLPDPVGSMRASVRALGPDGFLLIQTPAYPEGVSYAEMQATGSRFLEQLKANEHLYLFSPRSLRQFFAALGCDHVTFEPALFSHYDMFVVVGRQPARSFSVEEQVKALETTSGRLALSALDLYARAERAETAFAEADADRAARLTHLQEAQNRLFESEKDRAARLAEIELLGSLLQEVDADRAARLVEIERLGAQLCAADADRTARLVEIERLGAHLRAVEADSAERLAAAERAGAALAVADADRAARLEVINAAEARFAELGREMEALRRRIAELQAVSARLPSGRSS